MAVDNKLDLLIAALPPFSINGPLHLNIKIFIIAVLLLTKLAAYKGSVPCAHLRDRLHLPKTFERDPHASKLLKEHVNHKLSQARGNLKKIIKAGNDKNIFDLSTLLVNSTSCTVTVPFCGCVALLRKVFKVVPGDNFWKAVGDKLKKIKAKAAGNPVRVNRYFTGILKDDQETYHGHSLALYTIPTTVTLTDGWQLEVDNLIGGVTA
ncbi:hypothetical protein B0H34DRAFT_797177 [Crassisporium funariophilum]|nr:hypothetical protein B0H34DRAFT_797177 [Crassisporium funariophilum]